MHQQCDVNGTALEPAMIKGKCRAPWGLLNFKTSQQHNNCQQQQQQQQQQILFGRSRKQNNYKILKIMKLKLPVLTSDRIPESQLAIMAGRLW